MIRAAEFGSPRRPNSAVPYKVEQSHIEHSQENKTPSSSSERTDDDDDRPVSLSDQEENQSPDPGSVTEAVEAVREVFGDDLADVVKTDAGRIGNQLDGRWDLYLAAVWIVAARRANLKNAVAYLRTTALDYRQKGAPTAEASAARDKFRAGAKLKREYEAEEEAERQRAADAEAAALEAERQAFSPEPGSRADEALVKAREFQSRGVRFTIRAGRSAPCRIFHEEEQPLERYDAEWDATHEFCNTYDAEIRLMYVALQSRKARLAAPLDPGSAPGKPAPATLDAQRAAGAKAKARYLEKEAARGR